MFLFLKMVKLNEVLRSLKRKKETFILDYMVLWGRMPFAFEV